MKPIAVGYAGAACTCGTAAYSLSAVDTGPIVKKSQLAITAALRIGV